MRVSSRVTGVELETEGYGKQVWRSSCGLQDSVHFDGGYFRLPDVVCRSCMVVGQR